MKITSTELRQSVSVVLDTVKEGEPVHITRSGRPCAVLISADRYLHTIGVTVQDVADIAGVGITRVLWAVSQIVQAQGVEAMMISVANKGRPVTRDTLLGPEAALAVTVAVLKEKNT